MTSDAATAGGVGATAMGTGFAPAQPGIAAATLSLPTAGGAIRGIGEKFAANPATGTGSMSVPIADQPGSVRFRPAARAELRLRQLATGRSASVGRCRCRR